MHFESKLLEFDKVLQLIKDKAHTINGKEMVNLITPSNNHLLIMRLLNETAHALKILNEYQDAPFGGIRDISNTLKKAKVYQVLRPKEFLDVNSLLDGTNTLIRYYKNVKENEIEGEALDPLFLQLQLIPKLKNEINLVITERGEVNSHASNLLSKIRSNISVKERRVTERLQQIISKESSKLTESLITMRNSRFVVPVKLSEKNNFKGIIIDYSNSGETVYMEPTAVNEINNSISILKMDEIKEIERILRELSILVSNAHDSLQHNFKTITELDVIFAKARFSLEYECHLPEITKDEISLIKARHPLINNEEVVANTISFDKTEKIIIITGPNTGGKTVALKTMGLLSIMVQSGVLIPVNEESKTKIFDNIFADIGDEQSIEQSLSTFSSHMKKIILITNILTRGSLVLLDELGSGTDPKEGASLAIAILDFIRDFDIHAIATTHYPELKAYAYNKDDIVNASVEFNVDTLSPTYKLLLGTPGKSNALLISERLGLSKTIIKNAKESILTSQSEVTDLINKLENNGNKLEQKIAEYEDLLSKEKEVIKENIDLRQELLKEKSALKDKILITESKIIQDTKEASLKLLKEIEDLRKNTEYKDHELADLKFQARNFSNSEVLESATLDHNYSIGDFVNILKFNRPGELIERQKNGKWVVRMGTLSSNYDESDFEYLSGPKKKKNLKSFKSHVKKSVRPELDLRGMRYEEAQDALDKYIDDCLLTNIPFSTIIHGYGTLTLRKLVKEYLDYNPLIKSHRDGGSGEGGNGATIVYFK